MSTQVKTYKVKEYHHTLETIQEYPDGARESKCRGCGMIDSYEPGYGVETLVKGKIELCAVEVEKCLCIKEHYKGHAKCYELEEHVCSPCECDCHYSEEE